MEKPMIRIKGFTLIELMVVVVILGILSAIAYPSYTEHVNKGRRVDAKAALLDAAQSMERYYTENNAYPTTRGSVFSAASSDGNYALSLSSGTTTAYTISAAPVGRQTGDRCGTFTINNLGQTQVNGGTLTRTDCW